MSRFRIRNLCNEQLTLLNNITTTTIFEISTKLKLVNTLRQAMRAVIIVFMLMVSALARAHSPSKNDCTLVFVDKVADRDELNTKCQAACFKSSLTYRMEYYDSSEIKRVPENKLACCCIPDSTSIPDFPGSRTLMKIAALYSPF